MGGGEGLADRQTEDGREGSLPILSSGRDISSFVLQSLWVWKGKMYIPLYHIIVVHLNENLIKIACLDLEYY